MTEVGLLPFARVALQVATAILDRYRTPFSNTTQPQLLAILCRREIHTPDWYPCEKETKSRRRVITVFPRGVEQIIGTASLQSQPTL
jgi:hypothetical protein